MIIVYPENEKDLHNLSGIDCHCNPEIEFDDQITVFHNALTKKGMRNDDIVIEIDD